MCGSVYSTMVSLSRLETFLCYAFCSNLYFLQKMKSTYKLFTYNTIIIDGNQINKKGKYNLNIVREIRSTVRVIIDCVWVALGMQQLSTIMSFLLVK